MARSNGLVRLAWLAHTTAWLVQVHKHGVQLPKGIPGWQAFRVAMSPLWPFEGDSASGSWYGLALAVTSGVTNILILASVPIVFRGTPRQRWVLAWLCMLAVVVNAQWVIDKDWSDLRAGYYLWWASFLVVALGLFRR